jgi:hypothetical protein
MSWSKDNLLATGAEGKFVSVISSTGTLLQRCDLNDTPKNLKFSELKRDQRSKYAESTVNNRDRRISIE